MNTMDMGTRPFKTFEPHNMLGVTPFMDKVTGTKHVVTAQALRPPAGYYEVKKIYDSETAPVLNSNVRIRIPRSDFVHAKHSYLVFQFNNPIAGPTNAALLPTFDCLSDSTPIRLLYNKRIVQELHAKQIWYETTFHQSEEERKVSQKLMNVENSDNRTQNNTDNIKYYVLLSRLLTNHIHLPTASYAAEWEIQVKLDNLNRIVTGSDNTAATSTGLSRLYIVCHGINATDVGIAKAMHVGVQGLQYHFQDCTQIVQVRASGETTPVFSFPSIRGSVSNVVFFAVREIGYSSTTPSILNKSAFLSLGEGEFQFGTAASNDKWTQRPQELRMMRYNKCARESNTIQTDLEGNVVDYAVYTWELTPNEEMDIMSGQSHGSVMFDGTEQIKLNLNSGLAAEARFFFLFYQPTAAATKGVSTTTQQSH